ncbi:hypothetical protein H5410_030349 [Solanum commersonii]|uniref:Uncharacterized protein n=1 Tax=Solanum commersonii TaxID=4109 RepID=A0A9J5YE28_SOLCO|nr:hypothetical protein H5410_030349 [Solanum commersonii]
MDRNRIGGYNDPEFAILLSYTVSIMPLYLTQGRTKLQSFPNDPDLTFFQVSITGFPITNDVALIKSILLFSADSFFAYDVIFVDFIPQKVRAEDALAEIPKAEET